MDVAEYITSFQVIPHAKKGKMDGIKIPHGVLSKVTKGSDVYHRMVQDLNYLPVETKLLLSFYSTQSTIRQRL